MTLRLPFVAERKREEQEEARLTAIRKKVHGFMTYGLG